MTKSSIQANRKNLSFWELWNLSVGFFGIQFGWALQMSNTSAIYEYLGANPEQIPLLWLAAPVSGLIVQPIVGYFSDRTWSKLGRRRPYFLVGAILSSIALVLMPNSSTLWMAAGLLWILDTSINISTEPFRAFLADVLPRNQKTVGFAMQSFFIGAGAVIAAITPWLLTHVIHIRNGNSQVPLPVKISFYLGACLFLGCVCWTVFTTTEYPPENWQKFRQRQAEAQSLNHIWQMVVTLITNMPKTMQQLASVQFFTWLGMFCFFLYFPPTVAHRIFRAVNESGEIYTEGIEWAGICIGVYNFACFLCSWLLPRVAEITNRKITHSLCLFCGGCSIISLLFIENQYLLLLPMFGFGIAWASILAMPYAMLTRSLPKKNTGLYMGIFNFFIVIPQIIAALGLGWLVNHLFGNNPLLAVVLGGFSFLIASILVNFVEEQAQF